MGLWKATLLAAAALSLGAAPQPDSVSFELNSWGKLLESWTIKADGTGEVITTSNDPRGPGSEAGVRSRQRLAPDPARYRRLEQVLQPAKQFAGRELPCGDRMFDLPYGEVAWRNAGRERRLAFDSGCSSAAAKRVLASLKAANELVGQWAAEVPKIQDDRAQPPG